MENKIGIRDGIVYSVILLLLGLLLFYMWEQHRGFLFTMFLIMFWAYATAAGYYLRKYRHFNKDRPIAEKGALQGCPHCQRIHFVFKDIQDMTNREYWLMTEMFVALHDGKDYCNHKEK